MSSLETFHHTDTKEIGKTNNSVPSHFANEELRKMIDEEKNKNQVPPSLEAQRLLD
jgi:hypothetical protein